MKQPSTIDSLRVCRRHLDRSRVQSKGNSQKVEGVLEKGVYRVLDCREEQCCAEREGVLLFASGVLNELTTCLKSSTELLS